MRKMDGRDEVKRRHGQKRPTLVTSGKMRVVELILEDLWRGESIYILQVETKAGIDSSDLLTFSAPSRYSHGHSALESR